MGQKAQPARHSFRLPAPHFMRSLGSPGYLRNGFSHTALPSVYHKRAHPIGSGMVLVHLFGYAIQFYEFFTCLLAKVQRQIQSFGIKRPSAFELERTFFFQKPDIFPYSTQPNNRSHRPAASRASLPRQACASQPQRSLQQAHRNP